MGVRDSVNSNSKLGLGVGAAIIIVGVALIANQFLGRQQQPIVIRDSAFYTDDNGKTFFKDDVLKFVPYDRDGKQVYRVDVFESADGKKFVGLMYRHNPHSRPELEPFLTKKVKDPDGSKRMAIEDRVMEVKRPLDAASAWRTADYHHVEDLRNNMKSPSGAPATLVTP